MESRPVMLAAELDDQMVRLFDTVQTSDGPALQWTLRRSKVLTPRQVMGRFAAASSATAALALVFWGRGDSTAAVFLLLCLAAEVSAVFAYARHACDRDTVTLLNGRLFVEQHCGGKAERTELYAPFVRIEADPMGDGLVSVSERDVTLQLGRHLAPEQRPRFAFELRRALMTMS